MMNALALLLSAQAAAAPFPVPDCGLVPGWKQVGEVRSYDAENLFDYMNGASEGYFSYGFALMKGVTCVNAAGNELAIDVSEMGDPDHAWGFFQAQRDPTSPVEAIGSGAQVLPRTATFAKGRHYVEIKSTSDGDHRDALRAFVSALEARVPGEGRVPEAVAWFPPEGLVEGSIRLVPESVLGLRALKSGFLGRYAAGRAFVVPEAGPEAAVATLQALRARFTGATAVAGLADEAFAAQDPYLGRLVVLRKGARVAGSSNAATDADAAALARALAARLP
jgi:Family of unknown function (DUF6599)